MTIVQCVVAAGVDRISVAVRLGGVPDQEEPGVLGYDTPDADLRVLHAELGSFADAFHRKYEAERLTTAATRFRGVEDLFPVRRWNGRGWDVIAHAEGSGRIIDRVSRN